MVVKSVVKRTPHGDKPTGLSAGVKDSQVYRDRDKPVTCPAGLSSLSCEMG